MQNKIEFTDELLHYAANTLNNKTSCQQIRYWLNLNDCYSLEYFLQALTLVKHKVITVQYYQEVLQEFKIKEAMEARKPYPPRFMFPADEPRSFCDNLSNILTNSFTPN
jgi:hypothetical protein